MAFERLLTTISVMFQTELISDNDWQSIATAISDLTYPEFKPWLNKLNDFIVAFKNTSIIYRH